MDTWMWWAIGVGLYVVGVVILVACFYGDDEWEDKDWGLVYIWPALAVLGLVIGAGYCVFKVFGFVIKGPASLGIWIAKRNGRGVR